MFRQHPEALDVSEKVAGVDGNSVYELPVLPIVPVQKAHVMLQIMSSRSPEPNPYPAAEIPVFIPR
jgi:hypothetical protein